MNLAESSYQQGVVTDGKEVEERPHPYEDSCGATNHVNEDDENLDTSTVEEEEDQRNILIIGRIKIFLPNSQGEASIYVAGVKTKGKSMQTVIEEKVKEKILMSSLV